MPRGIYPRTAEHLAILDRARAHPDRAKRISIAKTGIKRPGFIPHHLMGKLGKDHPRYVEAPSYNALHSYIKRRLPKPESCENCGLKTALLDLANKSQNYLRDITDWSYLCRPCHRKYDKSFLTHCRNGHEYTPENTYINQGKRACRVCRHEASVRKRNKTKLMRLNDPIKYLGENI
jgi:hypothetical protein